MSKFVGTHVGMVHHRSLYRKGIVATLLRETKMFWVDKHGTKFRKSSGCSTGTGWHEPHVENVVTFEVYQRQLSDLRRQQQQREQNEK